MPFFLTRNLIQICRVHTNLHFPFAFGTNGTWLYCEALLSWIEPCLRRIWICLWHSSSLVLSILRGPQSLWRFHFSWSTSSRKDLRFAGSSDTVLLSISEFPNKIFQSLLEFFRTRKIQLEDHPPIPYSFFWRKCLQIKIHNHLKISFSNVSIGSWITFGVTQFSLPKVCFVMILKIGQVSFLLLLVCRTSSIWFQPNLWGNPVPDQVHNIVTVSSSDSNNEGIWETSLHFLFVFVSVQEFSLDFW